MSLAAGIAAQREGHGIPQAVSCRALGVSQAWIYKWRRGDVSPRRARRAALAAEIARLFKAHHGTYGAPRITADLKDAGWAVSENTVAAVMREQRLAARRKKRRKASTRPGKGRWRAPDLVGRDFTAAKVNQKWFGDGTEIWTADGKLYLASVLDVASRRILGFALSEHHDAQRAYGALAMAAAVRGGQADGVILHTDSEYVGAGVPGLPDPQAMDATGCWCQAAPGLPDPHSDRRRLSFLGYVGCPGAPGEAPGLAGGVT